MTLITGFTCPPTIYFKFITKCEGLLLQSATALFITKCEGLLLQSATAFLLQSATSVITKCDSFFYYKVRGSVITKCDSVFITKCDKRYYKVRQVLQSVTILLQSTTGITKCDDYYKLRQYKVHPGKAGL